MDWARFFGLGSSAPSSQGSDREPDSDDTKYTEPRCFVVMPFGVKINMDDLMKQATPFIGGDANLKLGVLDFDDIYKKIIKPAIKAAALKVKQKIDVKTSQEVSQSGFIHKEMLESIVGSDVVIVDITTQNANVFYELGVRHSFRKSTTILIRRKDTFIPFNIAGMRVFDYSDDETPAQPGEPSPLQKSVEDLSTAIAHSFRHQSSDSLIHNVLPYVSVQSSPFPLVEQRWIERDVQDLKHTKLPHIEDGIEHGHKRIGFITGDIMHVEHVDAWVNPENTNLEMARYHDGSISSLIRYFGADRDNRGRVITDTIGQILREIAGREGVEPGNVVITTAGQLTRSNSVKALFHVAVMQGEPGYGYQPVRDFASCFRRVLRNVDLYNLNLRPAVGVRRRLFNVGRPDPVRSVLCPLFGSRTAYWNPQDVAYGLFEAAVVFFQLNPHTKVKEIYLLAYTEQDKIACESAMGRLLQQQRIAATDQDMAAGALVPAGIPPPPQRPDNGASPNAAADRSPTQT